VFERAGRMVGRELHPPTVAWPASPHSWALSQVGCLNKTQPRAFHSRRTRPQPLFNAGLNNKSGLWNNLCWINAVFRVTSPSVNSAKYSPFL
jgi:hypothetical protein